MSSSLHEGTDTPCFGCACLALDCPKDSALNGHDSSDFGTMHFQEHANTRHRRRKAGFELECGCGCMCVVLANKIDNHFMTVWIIDPGSLSFLWPFLGGYCTVLSGPCNG